MRLTKENILDSISDLDAHGAIDELAGMLSRAVEEGRPKDIHPITEAMRSIERDLEVWADLEQKKLKAQQKDHEPEQALGTAEDLRKHEQYGGTKEDYL